MSPLIYLSLPIYQHRILSVLGLPWTGQMLRAFGQGAGERCGKQNQSRQSVASVPKEICIKHFRTLEPEKTFQRIPFHRISSSQNLSCRIPGKKNSLQKTNNKTKQQANKKQQQGWELNFRVIGFGYTVWNFLNSKDQDQSVTEAVQTCLQLSPKAGGSLSALKPKEM